MKKLTGWTLIILCSLFLFIFVLALIAIIPGFFNNNTEIQMSTKEIVSSSIGFIIVISLLILGLTNGLKRIKKEKENKVVIYNKVLNINLTGQIGYIDYRNLLLGISLKKPIYLVVLGIMLLFSLSFFANKDFMTNNSDSNYIIFILFGIVLISPLLTLIQIKKLYSTNKIFQEKLAYRLTNDSIQIKGETVDSIQYWTHFYQIRETKKFFMFYHGKMVATLIQKDMFTDNDLSEFQDFIKSLTVKII